MEAWIQWVKRAADLWQAPRLGAGEASLSPSPSPPCAALPPGQTTPGRAEPWGSAAQWSGGCGAVVSAGLAAYLGSLGAGELESWKLCSSRWCWLSHLAACHFLIALDRKMATLSLPGVFWVKLAAGV